MREQRPDLGIEVTLFFHRDVARELRRAAEKLEGIR